MMAILTFVLDLVLIGFLIAGLFYAVRLTRQLAEMRAGRAEMERFVMEFNATVARAEAGVRGLKAAARSSGDDLEKLIERGQSLRDELHFLTESADQVASRLSASATQAPRPSALEENAMTKGPSGRAESETKTVPETTTSVSSSVERDLLRALKKLG